MKYLFFDIECADGGKATICQSVEKRSSGRRFVQLPDFLPVRTPGRCPLRALQHADFNSAFPERRQIDMARRSELPVFVYSADHCIFAPGGAVIPENL